MVSSHASSSCISYDEAKEIAQNEIQRYLDWDEDYKQEDPTVEQIVTLVNNFKFDGKMYRSEFPYAGGNLTWMLEVKCDGKSYFDVVYTGGIDDPWGD